MWLRRSGPISPSLSEIEKSNPQSLILIRLASDTAACTTPQPHNSVVPSVGIGRYSDSRSVGIDLCRHLLAAAESGVGIAYTDRHVFSDRLSNALGAIYTDT
jgi:hypothetical protein